MDQSSKPPMRLQRKSYAGFPNSTSPPVQERVRRKSLTEVSRPERVIRNMKFGFAVGIQSEDKQKDFFQSLKSLADEDSDINIMRLANKAMKMERQYIGQYMASNSEDKVGQVLERPDSEAIMSYCYVDEDKSVKITEIYNVTDPDSMVLSEEERMLNSQLQWENNWINPPELKSAIPNSIADTLDDEEFNLSDAECDLTQAEAESLDVDSNDLLESVESDGCSSLTATRKPSFVFAS